MRKSASQIALAAMTILLIGAVPASAGLNMGFSGKIYSQNTFAAPGDWMQVGPLGPNDDAGAPFEWGAITSYSAPAGLPQVAGDLAQFGWAMTGTIDSINGHTIIYSGTYWILAPGYGFDTEAEYLEKGTYQMTAVFAPDWSTAAVTGKLVSEVGDRQPAGWPAPVDWSSANPGILSGSFDSATNTLTATVEQPDNLLILEPETTSLYVQPGENVVIDMNAYNLQQMVDGCQALIGYSSAFFNVGSVVPGTGSWTELIYESWAVPGELDTAIGLQLGGPVGTQSDDTVAVITMTAKNHEGTTQVVFRPDGANGYATMFSDLSANPVFPNKVDSLTIVVDGTAPTITCPADVEVSADAGACTATNVVLGMPTVTDNLAGVESVTNDAPSVFSAGETTVTWTATDRAGNVATCTQKVTVKDQEAPAITCPATVALECSNLTGIVVDGVIGANEWDGATQITVAGSKGTVSLKADDDYLYVLLDLDDMTDDRLGENTHGNDQVGLNIDPTDGQPWGHPYALIFQTGSDPNAWGGASSGDTDGWKSQLLVNNVQQSLPADLLTATQYSPTRVSEWRIPLSLVGKSIGDTIQVGGAVDIGDGNSYVFPVGLDWNDASTFTAHTLAVSYASGVATATDNCDPDPVITYTDVETPGACPQARTITRTWKAMDASGNENTCTQIITVEDSTPPVLTLPPDVTIECDESSLPSATGFATAQDGCDPVPNVTYSDAETPGTCPAVKIITRTWTATDACGNSVSDDQIITVEDTTKPVVTIDSAVQDGQELIGFAVNAVQGTVEITVSASDNCATLFAPTVTVTDAANNEVDVTGTVSGSGPWTYTYAITPATANGTATIKAIASDGCNSSDAVTATFEINKNQITGTVAFDTLSSSTYGFTRNVVFVATDAGGTVLKTWTQAVSFTNNSGTKVASGAYVLVDVPAGTVGLSAKTDTHLRKREAAGLDGDGQAVVPFVLLGGDVKADNFVNILDYSVLKTNWFTAGPTADINGDGAVNTLDYTLMQSNWFQSGDLE